MGIGGAIRWTAKPARWTDNEAKCQESNERAY